MLFPSLDIHEKSSRWKKPCTNSPRWWCVAAHLDLMRLIALIHGRNIVNRLQPNAYVQMINNDRTYKEDNSWAFWYKFGDMDRIGLKWLQDIEVVQSKVYHRITDHFLQSGNMQYSMRSGTPMTKSKRKRTRTNPCFSCMNQALTKAKLFDELQVPQLSGASGASVLEQIQKPNLVLNFHAGTYD